MMKHIFRSSSFIFIPTLLVLVLATWFLIGKPLVKKSITQSASLALGSKVEVDDLDIKVFPLGLELEGVDIAHPEREFENLVGINQVEFDIDPLALMLNQVIIKNLAIQGVRFGEKREESGDYDRVEAIGGAVDSVLGGGLSLDLKDIDAQSITKLIDKAPLETVQAAKDLQSLYQSKKNQIDQLKQNLPNPQQINQLKEELNAIIGGDFSIENIPTAIAQFKSLKEQVSHYQNLISQAKDLIANAQGEVKSQLNRLNQAKTNDQNKLLALSQGDFSNMGLAQMLLDEKWAKRLEQATSVLKTIKQKLEVKVNQTKESLNNDSGRFIDFLKEAQAQFVAEKFMISALLPFGEVVAEGANLSDLGLHYQKPVTAEIAGKNLSSVHSIAGDIKVDAQQQGLHLMVNGLQLKQQSFGLITIREATLDTQAQLSVNKGNLNGEIKVTLNRPSFEPSQSKVGSLLANTLSGQSKVDIIFKLSGSLDKPHISATSNLIANPQTLLTQALKSQQGDLMAKISQGLEGKLTGLLENQDYLSLLGGDLGSLGDITSQISELEGLQFSPQSGGGLADKAKGLLKGFMK